MISNDPIRQGPVEDFSGREFVPREWLVSALARVLELDEAARSLSDSLERFRVPHEHAEDCEARNGGACYGHDEPTHEEQDHLYVEAYADLMAKELALRAALGEVTP